MTVSDFIVDFLVKKGISDIFLVSGGGIMHLCDAVVRNKKIRYISNHHEQASAICAEAYARIRNGLSACIVTTGPGGTNALTGVAGAWTDSVPVMIISGQVRTNIIADYRKLRQLGPQELNVVEMAKPITKYVKTIKDPNTIRYELEKAFYFATTGRPGPVWLDVPLDIQSAIVDKRKLTPFIPPVINMQDKIEKLEKNISKVFNLLNKSKRPLLILGHGVRLAHAEKELINFIKKLNAPIVLPYNGMDLVPYDEPLLVGKFGPVGNRSGNFALQNADLLIVIGASLSLASRGFDIKGFAPKAKKIMVDIDKGELTKSTITLDLAIQADAKDFIKYFIRKAGRNNFSFDSRWYNACSDWKNKYPAVIPEFYKDKKYVNTYVFMDVLSDILTEKDIVLSGNSLDAVSLYQAFKVKKGQRVFTNENLGAMGWCLPASIGACVKSKNQTILVTGDGSIQFNIQELATISYYKFPVKIFIVNNDGYESIRSTQGNFFEGRFVGSDKHSGISNPDFRKLAAAYNLPFYTIKNNSQIKVILKKIVKEPGPVLCELVVNPDQHRVPKATSFRKADGTMESRPIHDMAPFLDREEVEKNMSLFDN
jgi:acetolactate synthase-1/2/3 large subunit